MDRIAGGSIPHRVLDEVDLDALVDDAVDILLRRLNDEVTAIGEDVHARRLERASDRCRRLADILRRSQPHLDEWLDARARRLAEQFEEVDADV